jgi:hypothetical protein
MCLLTAVLNDPEFDGYIQPFLDPIMQMINRMNPQEETERDVNSAIWIMSLLSSMANEVFPYLWPKLLEFLEVQLLVTFQKSHACVEIALDLIGNIVATRSEWRVELECLMTAFFRRLVVAEKMKIPRVVEAMAIGLAYAKGIGMTGSLGLLAHWLLVQIGNTLGEEKANLDVQMPFLEGAFGFLAGLWQITESVALKERVVEMTAKYLEFEKDARIPSMCRELLTIVTQEPPDEVSQP